MVLTVEFKSQADCPGLIRRYAVDAGEIQEIVVRIVQERLFIRQIVDKEEGRPLVPEKPDASLHDIVTR